MTHPTKHPQAPVPIPPTWPGLGSPTCPACHDTCTCWDGTDHTGEWWRCPTCGHGFILTPAGYALTPGARPIGVSSTAEGAA